MTELEEQLYRSYKVSMEEWFISHPEHFDEAMRLAISDTPTFAWRSAWLISNCISYNDKRVKKYLPQIINSIENKKDGHQRELIKILLQIDIDEKIAAPLYDICVRLWEKITSKPSIRIVAFRMILKISKKYPEFKQEIPLLLREHFIATLSPGIRNSLNRLMKEHSIPAFDSIEYD